MSTAAAGGADGTPQAECTFYFLRAELLRSGNVESLPVFSEALKVPGLVTTRTINLCSACLAEYSSNYLAVSHRWEAQEAPDSRGEQFERLREFLRTPKGRPFEYVWYDYSVMPQGRRDPQEQEAFLRMLREVNLVFLGCFVLVIMDRSYLSRFWTQFEGWLSFQHVTSDGLASDATSSRRNHIVTTLGAPASLALALVEEWSSCMPSTAHQKLAQPDVAVTNQRDKDEQLPKLLHFNSAVKGALSHAQLAQLDQARRAVREPEKPRLLPRVLLMGACRSGKSAIHKVVFEKMVPHEAAFLSKTNKIVKVPIDTLVPFELWDIPGFDHPQAEAAHVPYAECFALVWVIDAEDEYDASISRLCATMVEAVSVHPTINVDVFLHKVDCLGQDERLALLREVQSKAGSEMGRSHLEGFRITFHLTSIFEHTLIEAFSAVVQHLLSQRDAVTSLLDVLCIQCNLEKAYLLDVASKLYFATDSSENDLLAYELCVDVTDAVIDVGGIYGEKEHRLTTGIPPAISDCEITLSSGMALLTRHVHRSCALVCILRTSVLAQQGVIDYNAVRFVEAFREILKIR